MTFPPKSNSNWMACKVRAPARSYPALSGAFYCVDNGRDSVPPSLLATALLLQSHDKVSDAEAKARADFDLRWKSLPSATTGGAAGD